MARQECTEGNSPWFVTVFTWAMLSIKAFLEKASFLFVLKQFSLIEISYFPRLDVFKSVLHNPA